MRWILTLLLLAGCGGPPGSTTGVVTQPDQAQAPPGTSGHVPSAAASRATTTYAWRWDGDEPGFGRSFYHTPRSVTGGGLTCTFTYSEAARLARTACDVSGRELWHHDEGDAFVEDASLLLDHGTLYVARYSDISNGCTVHAFDARAGVVRWTTPLRGLGPVAHSEYLNAVELRLVGGRAVAFGWESAGRYVEALDPSTGAVTYHALVP